MIDLFDDVLVDPDAYRAAALRAPFESVTLGADTFHGIAPVNDFELIAWLLGQYRATGPFLTFFRRSPAGQVEPHDVHTDQMMGRYTVILYLNPDPPDDDGTVFWRHRLTGAMDSSHDAAKLIPVEAWADKTQWRPWSRVRARYNRVVVFPSALYHSRALPQHYGTTPETARLVQVVFGGSDYGSSEYRVGDRRVGLGRGNESDQRAQTSQEQRQGDRRANQSLR